MLAPCRFLSALLMASADVSDYHLHCLMSHSVVDCCGVVVGFFMLNKCNKWVLYFIDGVHFKLAQCFLLFLSLVVMADVETDG